MNVGSGRIGRLLGMVVWLCLPLAVGCAGFFPKTTSTSSSTTTNTGDYAYVASAYVNGSKTVYTLSGYTVGTAALTELSGFPITLSVLPSSVVINPANTFLYVAGEGEIYGYSISSAGALTAISANNSSILAEANVVSMDISPDGNWLLALDSDGVTIDEFQIASDGLLTAATGTSYTVTSGGTIVPTSLRFAPTTSNSFLAISLGTGGDLLYTFNTSTGVLTEDVQVNVPTTASSDQALTFNAAGTILYIARSGTDGGVVVYTIGSGGALTLVTGSPFATGNGPASMVIDKTGDYLYVGNKVDGTISGFSIATTGVLTALSGSPYASGADVSALGRDNSGDYILSANLGGSPDVSMYSFDATALGKLDSSTTAATGDPNEPAGALAIALMH
jgi:6-phosphogluconolactonase (cycloisomerase 2 family)